MQFHSGAPSFPGGKKKGACWIHYNSGYDSRAATLPQSETDVLYLQMTGVNMQSAMQRVGGWAGRGMTIGFRE